MSIIRKPLLELDGRRFGHVVFYRLPCGLICRTLNPHTRKRVLKDPQFAAFRACSKRMAKASKIGSAIYKSLPEDFREFWMYRAFVGEAMKMLKDPGMTGEQVLESLFRTYVEVWYLKAEIKEAEKNEAQRSTGSIKRSRTVELNIRWKEYNETVRRNKVEVAFKFNTADKPAEYLLSSGVGIGPPDLI